MKRMSRFPLVVVLCAFSLLFLTHGLVKAETITLKGVTAWPKNIGHSKGMLTLVEVLDEMVAKQAPGELKIQYVGGPESVKTSDQVQAVQRGMVDIANTSGAYYTHILPDIDALKMTEWTPAEERTNGVFNYLVGLHEKIGIRYLGRTGANIKFHLYMNKPMKAADLKGLNIRVSPLYLPVIKGLGGNPVVIAPTDVYPARERNVVDGYGWPAVGITDWGWQKVTKYQIEPGFYLVGDVMLMNMASWNKLSKKLQDMLTQAVIESENRTMAFWKERSQNEAQVLAKAGVQVLPLPPAEQTKLLQVVYEESWKDLTQKAPKTAPELKKLLTKAK